MEPDREKKQGRRIMQPEIRFLRQWNLAMGKGEPPEKRTPTRAFSC